MLIEVLRRAAGEVPDQPALISTAGTLTYAAAVERAEAIARGLRERGIERFGSYLDDPADVLLALAAASAAGVEACTYSRELDREGVERVASTFAHRAIVTDRELELESADAIPIDELAGAGGDLPAPDSSPLMILTTGTTGHQKAARYDWAALVGTVRHPDERPGERWLLAYNLNQFAGIQILLHGLTSQATLVSPPSRRPADVVATIRDHDVTRASATPTFWRLVTGGLSADEARELPLRQITLGGEAVTARLLERLATLFPDAQISQIYGSTEVGTVVSVRDGRPGLPLSILDRDDDAAVQLRIVDGEIQTRSRIGMLGYHAEDSSEAGWRPTGDLVEVVGDRILFVGRKSEIINVGGAKVHPLPIEEVASAVEGVSLVSAYGRPNPVTGQIVALDVVPEPGAEPATVERAIREACEAAFPPAGRPRRIRIVESLEIRGDKLARLGTREDR